MKRFWGQVEPFASKLFGDDKGFIAHHNFSWSVMEVHQWLSRLWPTALHNLLHGWLR